jgi:hypothetical protein
MLASKHGTFRPKLLQLVQSNDAKHVKQVTISAFKLLPDTTKALKVLTNLKGVGPATASLLLSVAAPDSVPFFSDELFRWCMWDEPGSSKGWQRKIKYNAKEYEMLLKEVGAMRTRLGVRAVDAEKVAWMLGKEAINVDEDAADATESVGPGPEEKEYLLKEAKGVLKEMKTVLEGTKRVREETEKLQEEVLRVQSETKAMQREARELLDQETPEPDVTKGTKRKAKPVTEGTRKSTRTKK